MAFFVSPRWSPDGRSILVLGLDLTNRSGVYQIEVASGRASFVIGGPDIGEYEWSADGRALLYRKGPATIVSRNLATGAETTILDLTPLDARLVASPGPPIPLMLRTFQLSPDGRRVAITMWSGGGDQTRASLAVFEPGARPSKIHTARRLGFHGWTPDGSALLFTTPATGLSSRPSSALWSISANGGIPRATGIELPGLSMVRISPDGPRLTFTAGFDGGEVRMAERCWTARHARQRWRHRRRLTRNRHLMQLVIDGSRGLPRERADVGANPRILAGAVVMLVDAVAMFCWCGGRFARPAEVGRRASGQSERHDVRPRRDGDELPFVEHIRHR